MKTNTEYVVDTKSVAFRIKVRWFKDILNHLPARQYLWNLYYAGEAYEELHPDGVFVNLMPAKSPIQRQLAKHLNDETRHATIFHGLLEARASCGTTIWNIISTQMFRSTRCPSFEPCYATTTKIKKLF